MPKQFIFDKGAKSQPSHIKAVNRDKIKILTSGKYRQSKKLIDNKTKSRLQTTLNNLLNKIIKGEK